MDGVDRHGNKSSRRHTPLSRTKTNRSCRREGWSCQNSTRLGTTRKPDQKFGRRIALRSAKRRVNISCTPEEFVAALAEHVPDRYRHGIRYFGLLAPRAKARTSAAVFALLGQHKRSRPRRLSWAFSRRRDFGVDPLIDGRGQPMHRAGRLKPRVQDDCPPPPRVPPKLCKAVVRQNYLAHVLRSFQRRL